MCAVIFAIFYRDFLLNLVMMKTSIVVSLSATRGWACRQYSWCFLLY